MFDEKTAVGRTCTVRRVYQTHTHSCMEFTDTSSVIDKTLDNLSDSMKVVY